jgi:hypothetical protein
LIPGGNSSMLLLTLIFFPSVFDMASSRVAFAIVFPVSAATIISLYLVATLGFFHDPVIYVEGAQHSNMRMTNAMMRVFVFIVAFFKEG